MNSFFNKIIRTAKPPKAEAHNILVISVGEFAATEKGVIAKVKDPISVMSGAYKWKEASEKISDIHSIVSCGDNFADIMDSLSMSEDQKDRLEEAIGLHYWGWSPDSAWASDIDRLLEWGAGLLSVCPNEGARRSLSMLGECAYRKVG